MTDTQTGAAEQPAATIRDSLVAAMTELAPDESAAEGAPEGTKPEGTEPAQTATEPTDGRARDAQGRFTTKEGETAPTETPAAPKDKTATATATEKPAEQTQTTEQPGTPPAHWSAEDKAFAQKIPAELRAEYIDRFKKIEAGFTPKLQRAAALEKDYGEIDQHFQPYAQAMQSQGWTKGSLIKAWADVELALAKDPYAQMREIAKHYKVDLRKLAGIEGTPQQQQDTATLVATGGEDLLNHPHIKALNDQLQALTGKLDGMTAAEQRRATEAQNAATQRTLSDIQSFAEAKGEDGKPSHPHFNDVMNDMLVLAQAERSAGRTPVLQDLYDKAVWGNSQTRATQTAALIAKAKAETEAAQRQQSADAKAKSAKAQKAGSSVTGAPSGSGQTTIPKSKGSLRDDIEAAANDADG